MSKFHKNILELQNTDMFLNILFHKQKTCDDSDV